MWRDINSALINMIFLNQNTNLYVNQERFLMGTQETNKLYTTDLL